LSVGWGSLAGPAGFYEIGQFFFIPMEEYYFFLLEIVIFRKILLFFIFLNLLKNFFQTFVRFSMQNKTRENLQHIHSLLSKKTHVILLKLIKLKFSSKK
jgi:hypothetical protein